MSRNFEEFLEALESGLVRCFWGKISREKVENILAGKPIGSYLIREMEGKTERNFENFEGFVKWENCIASFPLCGYCPDCAQVLAGFTIKAKTHDGHIYQAVNWTRPFSLQELSISKILCNGTTQDEIIQLELSGGHRHELTDDLTGNSEHPEEGIPKTK